MRITTVVPTVPLAAPTTSVPTLPEDWGTAVHEAGHAVVSIRNGGVIYRLHIGNDGDEDTVGITYHKAYPPTIKGKTDALVAGYFCDRTWGTKDFDSYASRHDAEMLLEGRSIATARKAWNTSIRRLATVARRDPTFELQVKAVALALCKDKVLNGDEVVAIMKPKPVKITMEDLAEWLRQQREEAHAAIA
jgi:hypothetical protein